MLLRSFSLLLITTISLPSAFAQTSDQPLNNPTEWFKRAYDALDLRVPGAAPFHMKVSFRAFPGQEFRGFREKNEIVTGDGRYEETWISTNQWRREVWLGEYHAVEVQSPATGRKMHSDSEYEPSRVLMLLNALYYPIPRYLVSSEFKHRGGSGWKIDDIDFAGQSLVRISKSVGSQSADYTDAFVFQPHGLLNLRNQDGMSIVWSDYEPFASKLVAKELTILAGDRKLITAHITIEPPSEAKPREQSEFDLPGAQAEPGTTLRPLQFYEVRLPDLSDHWVRMTAGNSQGKPIFLMRSVLDQHGRYRELEIIYAPNPADAENILAHFRSLRHKPPTIDGSPCEFAVHWAWM